MKTYLPLILISTLAACFLVADDARPPAASNRPVADDPAQPPPRLIRLTATVDGTDRFRFTPKEIKYDHKQWMPIENMTFQGDAWPDLTKTPPAWQEMAGQLDLARAWIVKRQGRDVIALEHTPDGFDLYLCDSLEAADTYEVTIAIPER